jgi:lipoprotein-anchoring transpeptidase ErfK/SrfK
MLSGFTNPSCPAPYTFPVRAAVVVGIALASVVLLTACGEPAGHREPQRAATATPHTSASAATPSRATATAAVAPIASTPTAQRAASSPCAPNRATKAILVGVRRQHMWLCARHHLAYSAAVTTGAVDRPYGATPVGTFRIQARQRDQVLTLLSGRQYTVRYWIPFDAPLFGFHDSPWQRLPYGSPKYRTRGSHGCIHAPLAAMRFLYAWADVGTAVRIRR